MIDSLFSMLFRCSHRRLTRPVTPVSRFGAPGGGAYVVCLDCGKQFDYDTKLMSLGKIRERSHEAGVLSPDLPKPRPSRMTWAAALAFPVAVVLGFAMKSRKAGEPASQPPARRPGQP